MLLLLRCRPSRRGPHAQAHAPLLAMTPRRFSIFPLQVSEDKFLQACECALNHLQANFRGVARSIRATCRGGRVLYDRHVKKLNCGTARMACTNTLPPANCASP